MLVKRDTGVYWFLTDVYLRPHAKMTAGEIPGATLSKQNLTINDIARLAGVSKKSVSRVINNERGVSESTRERIKAIMTEAGYQPDRRARALASQRSFLIGLAYNNRNPSYILEMLAGSQKAANAQGYEVVMHQMAEGVHAADEVSQFMRRSACDALIITPPLSESATLIAELAKQPWPLVRVAGDYADFNAPQIRYNDRTATLSLTHSLIQQGHQRIAFLGGPQTAGPTIRRLSGVRDALALHNLELPDSLVRYGDFTFESGARFGAEFLSVSQPPTAIMCANDEMAAGVYRSAAAAGLMIPRDLSVTGFDDSPVASHLYPALTSVRQPIQEMMALAVEILTAQARTDEHGVALFDATVVARDSTDTPRPNS